MAESGTSLRASLTKLTKIPQLTEATLAPTTSDHMQSSHFGPREAPASNLARKKSARPLRKNALCDVATDGIAQGVHVKT